MMIFVEYNKKISTVPLLVMVMSPDVAMREKEISNRRLAIILFIIRTYKIFYARQTLFTVKFFLTDRM